MTDIDTLCESAKLRLIAAADFLMACKMTAGQIIPVQGKNWIIAIGPREWIVKNVADVGVVAQSAETPAIGKLLDEFSALPVLWGLNEPGALVRHGDVFKMLVNAGKTYLASTTQASTAQAEPGATIALSANQLRAALDFINPDGPADEDQCSEYLYFGKRQHRDDDGTVSTDMCCWNDDTDGVLPLPDEYFAPAVTSSTDAQASTAQAERANANLYGAIMNLPCNPPDGWSRIQQTGYTIGHRDARHAAAELVNAQNTAASSTDAQVAAEVRDAARDVLAERRRQIEAEGWVPEHDDKHDIGEMAAAACCYSFAGSEMVPDEVHFERTPMDWPWAPEWWKPSSKRRNLVKAGALILAEIERIDRAARRAGDTKGEQADGGGA